MNHLADLLDAEPLSATIAVLPAGRRVSVATYLRTEVPGPSPVARTAGCWAPNKPAILVDGRPTWAEFGIVRALERHGWEGRWIKNWAGGREFCMDVGESRPMPPHVEEVFAGIHSVAAALKGSGSWDVLAWRGDDVRFLESKKHRSGDRLRPSQLTWLEAALSLGHDATEFAVVEYRLDTISRGTSTTARTTSRARPTNHGLRVDPGLAKALEAARAADPGTRIAHRDPLASFGEAAIGPVGRRSTASFRDLRP
jgi:hypothetical protein